MRLYWAEMLQTDELEVRNEEKLFESVLIYADQYCEEPEIRDEVLVTLLPLVRYSFLRGNFILDAVEANASLSHLPIVHQLLYDAYKHKMYPKATPEFSVKPRKGFQKFDGATMGSNIKLTEDETTASMISHAGWQSVRCVCPFSSNMPYFEFKVEASTNVMIGAADTSCPNTGYAGQYANGWQYYSQGGIYHQSATTGAGTTYGAGDRVGVKVDSEKGEITWYKNEAQVGSSTGLPKGTKLYPIVSFSAMNDKVSIVPRALEPSGSTEAQPQIPKRWSRFGAAGRPRRK